jgi:hypothetical protein
MLDGYMDGESAQDPAKHAEQELPEFVVRQSETFPFTSNIGATVDAGQVEQCN